MRLNSYVRFDDDHDGQILPHSSSVLDVVTATRLQVRRKREYSMKIRDIRFDSARETSTGVVAASSSSSDSCCSFDEIYDRRSFPQKYAAKTSAYERTKILITNKGTSRNVCLEWSKYCTSALTEPISVESDRRCHYLSSKYWHLWRVAAFAKRTSAIGQSKRCRSQNKDDFAKRLIGAQKTKIRQQEATIQELRAIRASLEQQKFALETDRLLREHELEVDDADSIKRKIKYLRDCGSGGVKRAAVKSAGSSSKAAASTKYDTWWSFVSRMDIRAEERRKHWAEIKERKRNAEKQRRERLAYERRKREEYEYACKKRKVLEMRCEKRRREELKRKHDEERERLAELNSMADSHYRQRLAKSSLAAFGRCVEMARIEDEHARQFYERKIRTLYFVRWKLWWRLESEKKDAVADQFYEFTLMRIGLDRLKVVRFEYIQKLQVSEDFYDLCLSKNYFQLWIRYCRRCKRQIREKEMIASQHNEKRLLRNSYEKWKELPRINFVEQEKKQRLRQWCNTVQELLPDFISSYQ